MDERFLIYKGFKNDAEQLFNIIIEKFSLEMTNLSDYGLRLENNKVIIDISYETGLQIWLNFKSENKIVLLPILCMEKGILNQYNNIIKYYKNGFKADAIKELSNFLFNYLRDELIPSSS